LTALKDMGVNEKYVRFDLEIARGLDYYTGTVFETNLIGYENLGSICSGGRYDDLASIFTQKKLPGVGISIGLTRLLWQLFNAEIITPDRTSITDILIIPTDSNFISASLKLATELRQKNLNIETFLEDKKIAKKFHYADKNGIPYAIIIGEDEIQTGKVQLKNMKTGEQNLITINEITKNVKNL